MIIGTAQSSAANPAAGTNVVAKAACPNSTVLFGGGFALSGDTLQLTVVIVESRPVDTTTWTVTARNYVLGIGSFSVQARAICST